MADGQYDVIPVFHGESVDAVEMRAALAKGGSGLRVSSRSSTGQKMWFEWIGQYLYFFST